MKFRRALADMIQAAGPDAQVQQAQGGLRAERGDKEGELRAERGDGRTVRQTSTHTLSAAIGDAR